MFELPLLLEPVLLLEPTVELPDPLPVLLEPVLLALPVPSSIVPRLLPLPA